MKSTRYIWAPLLVLLTATGQASAQSTVEARVQKLEETIRVLEQRIANLEGQRREGSTRPSVTNDKVKWRKLQKGMSEGDVEELLGSPEKVDAFGSFTIWHYGRTNGGQVEFGGESRTVRAWHEP
jgi:outer membrane protein assembly factor BamE (lipoprotein component of BamABCDE complex)